MNRLQFQLRYCPALAKKPKASSKEPDQHAAAQNPDPFANPPPELLVAELPLTNASHILVLNKYPIIPNHFILATKTSKPQTDVLEELDLDAAHACLRSWEGTTQEGSPRRLFAFFNSGEHSGASQAHRHLQFLPHEDMAELTSQTEWQLLIDRMNQKCNGHADLFYDPSLPFKHYATSIPPEPTSSLLYRKYLALYRAAAGSVHPSEEGSASGGDSVSKNPIEATISYNLAMTLETMAICPRRSESADIPSKGGETSVAINGTILGGTLMVKDEEEWRNLREDRALLDHVLSSIGLPMLDGPEFFAHNKL